MTVAITGAGCVSPIGATRRAFLSGLRDGALGVRPAWWSDRAGQVALFAAVDDRFDPAEALDARVLDGSDLHVAFGVAAAEEALDQADLTLGPDSEVDPTRVAVVGGTSMGGFYSLMEAQATYERVGGAGIRPKSMLKIWSNMTPAQLTIRHGLHGPSLTITTACAAALDAVGQAAALVGSGQVDVALCGGTEGGAPRAGSGHEEFVPVTSVAGRLLGMETPEVDPERAVLPFDVDRSGIVFGEGAAWFVLESPAHAERRGATPIGLVRGYATGADAHHPSSPDPDGRWEAHVIRSALDRAGVHAGEVDAIFAHATGTMKGDLAEIRAINRVHTHEGRTARVVVTAIKGHTGHAGAASGGMSLVAALEAFRTGQVPPIRGSARLEPDIAFDAVLHRARHLDDCAVAQVNAFGFGGQNACLVVSRP